MVTARAVQLPGSDVHVLHSDAVGDDFEISVFEPPPGVEGPLPVVYCTDANNSVGMSAEIVASLSGTGEIPPVRLICVGYPIGGDFQQFVRLRTRDFMVTRDAAREAGTSEIIGSEVQGGGGGAFLEFLTGELRRWVESSYDVTGDSTYVGDSMGGLFGVYTLTHRPEAFRRYVIGSPWLCWDRATSTGWEAEYAATHDDLDATVFLAAGSDEEVLPPAMPEAMAREFRGAEIAELTRALASALEGRQYPSLRLTTRIFPEVTHFTMQPVVIAHGLRNVFTAEREAGG